MTWLCLAHVDRAPRVGSVKLACVGLDWAGLDGLGLPWLRWLRLAGLFAWAGSCRLGLTLLGPSLGLMLCCCVGVAGLCWLGGLGFAWVGLVGWLGFAWVSFVRVGFSGLASVGSVGYGLAVLAR